MDIKENDLVSVTSKYYNNYKNCIGCVLKVHKKYYIVKFPEMKNQVLNLYPNELRLLSQDELNVIDLIE